MQFSITDKKNYQPGTHDIVLPFALPIVEGKKLKKKCCRKFKKGKRCKRCPGRKE